MIGHAIDARRQRFPEETPFVYRPHAEAGEAHPWDAAGRAGMKEGLTYRWDEEAKAGIKDYNLLDLSI